MLNTYSYDKIESKTINHLFTKYDRILGHDYSKRNNDVVIYIYLELCHKFEIRKQEPT